MGNRKQRLELYRNQLLANLLESSVIDRMSLEARKAEVEKEIAKGRIAMSKKNIQR